MSTLCVPQGDFALQRFPHHPKDNLRAWDAADEYLLQQIADENRLRDGVRILILNDSFGALAVALSHWQPTIQSDSWLAHAGIRDNLQLNGLAAEGVRLHHSLAQLGGPFDLVLMKLPHNQSMLEDQLHRLRDVVSAETRIIAADMAKQIHTSTLQLFEKILGPTRTSLARKKARLIFCEKDESLQPGPNPYPKSYLLDGTRHLILNHSGVFSREKLDIGSRFFLEHLPVMPEAKHIVDLGCGNGVVGLMAAEKNPQANLIFSDESWMAMASARANFETAFAGKRQAEYRWTDCLSGVAENSVDLVLNNPPFHQQTVVGDFIAKRMFRDARQALRPGGQLWVIGNRHLGYHVILKKLFGNVHTVASNPKFVILQASKP
ncbi:MAG: methyltransferase [Gammaproteobacteria bacterium]|nr:methyltransferase [Gammaproteobacteria bacterium]